MCPAGCYPAGVEPCPFCSVAAERIWIENQYAIAFRDALAVTDGHVPIVPRKHVSSTYELEMDEQQAIWKLVAKVRQRLVTGLKPPDGFNIGFNGGLAAGQKVQHAQRGGIRWVVANNAPYWNK